jgi:hypothetical protein
MARMKAAAWSMVLVAISGSANALGQVCTTEYRRDTGGPVQTGTAQVSVPRFDPTKGQLLGVTFRLTGDVNAVMEGRSTCGNFTTFRGSFCGFQQFTGPGFVNPVGRKWFYLCKSFTPPNNVDFLQPLGSEAMDSGTFTLSANNLPSYVGSGSVNFAVSLSGGDDAEATTSACVRPDFDFHAVCPAATTPFCMNKGVRFNWSPVLTVTYRYRTSCVGDLNCSGTVDDSDFSIFATAYDTLVCTDPAMPSGCPSDFNRDGFVDDTDFVGFVTSYDRLVCP